MYVNLHTHSHYSFLDGVAKVKDLCQRANDYGQTALALTDHGHMASAIPLLKYSKDYDVKPIVGCEVYMSVGSRLDRGHSMKVKTRPYYHLTLLAINKQGYKNLVYLTSEGYRSGFYYKPRIDWELLKKHNEGLVCLSGCIGSELAWKFFNSETPKADTNGLIAQYKYVFEDRYFLEISDNDADMDTDTYDMQTRYSSYLGSIADNSNSGRVCFTGDSHYLDHAHHHFHDCMLAVGSGTWVGDEKRQLKFHGHYHLKSEQEVSDKALGYHPSAISSTQQVADMVEDYDLLSSTFFIPSISKDPDIVLRNTVYKNRLQCYPALTDEVKDRIVEELDIIVEKGFSEYFLILMDVCQWAKKQGIVLGYGRGSSAGSIVSYILGITQIDPLRFDLLFSRFLNKERDDLPDIDIDIEDTRRDEVIDYLRKRFGEDKVLQIGSYGTIGAKTAIRDIGRSLHVPIPLVEKICKYMPDLPDTTLSEVENSPEIRNILGNKDIPSEFWDLCLLAEGNVRQFGIHAAGVAILPEHATNLIPTYRKSGKGVDITQYDMKGISDMGILKMDFLGLRTLRVVSQACNLAGIDRDDVPLDDEPTYALIAKGKTAGVFQIEGEGYKNFVMELKPDTFDMLIDTMALYRPSTMDNGDMYRYLARRHKSKPVEYFVPEFKNILKDTLGICLYQEQAMLIAQKYAMYSLHEADTLRRIFGKKLKHKIPEERKKFIKKATAYTTKSPRFHTPEQAGAVFDYIATFAGYGFNKAHATSYAYLCYWTAYLSANHPIEFYVATLNSLIHDSDRIKQYLMHIKERDIVTSPPNINVSSNEFTMGEGGIYYGLQSVKYVGEKASRHVVMERLLHGNFSSIDDFRSRIPKTILNSRAMEMLVNVGAFDSIDNTRATMDYSEKLKFEYEGLGMYISGHPLDQFKDPVAINIVEIKPDMNGRIVKLITYVTGIHKHTTKNKKKMAFLTCADSHDTLVDVVVFPEVWKKCGADIEKGSIYEVVGKINYRTGAKSIVGDYIKQLEWQS